MPRKRLRIGLVFGGRSAEHGISRISALNIWRHLDPRKYEVIPIAISRDGCWFLQERGQLPESAKNALPVYRNVPEVFFLSRPGSGLLVSQTRNSQLATRNSKLDVVFPALHGPNGEDGTIQGLLELSGIPYVGCGVLASAVGMDKDAARRLAREAGIPVTPWRMVLWWEPRGSSKFQVPSSKPEIQNSKLGAATLAHRVPGSPRTAQPQDFYRNLGEEVGGDFGWPVFVKPARLGSSVGISKVGAAKGLQGACELAFRYDDKILIEKAVIGAREIECAVLGDSEDLWVATPGEIRPKHEFYSYQAKYLDPDGAEFQIPAGLNADQMNVVQKMARESFLALGAEGLGRVDFLMDPKSGSCYFNEINTMPGFTSISMYPKMMEATGLPLPKLLDRLIELAMKRQKRRSRLRVK
ncbi:MAG: D-alanine--D-alanine ligase [Elusimicrobia bacterium]|nr:D-alanine--D-alanine ligase [Elusimicrobiota bacterium]